MPKPISRKKKEQAWTIELQSVPSIYVQFQVKLGAVRIGDLCLIRGEYAKAFIEKLRQAGFEITTDA